jgi:hypothetical protein
MEHLGQLDERVNIIQVEDEVHHIDEVDEVYDHIVEIVSYKDRIKIYLWKNVMMEIILMMIDVKIIVQ